jgi:glutamine amidotransferase
VCRQFAYLGSPKNLASLVYRSGHSLVVQSYLPRDMRGAGSVNVDGFGVGWYGSAGRGQSVRRYRRAVPIWQDANFRELAEATEITCAVAAVRSATPGMPVSDGACAPFTDGRYLFSHNGRIVGWPSSAAGLAGELPVQALLTLDAPTDSALLWALLRIRLDDGMKPADALADVIQRSLAAAPHSWLTTLLSDGSAIYASTYRHALWVKREDAAVTLASEPFDENPSWQPVADRQLVTATPAAVETRPLTAGPL